MHPVRDVIHNPQPSPAGTEPVGSSDPDARRERQSLEGLEQAHRDWQINWEERRSHQRYPLGTPFACNLELDSGHYPPMPVQLQDISLGGACLLISSLVELRQGEMGELRQHTAPASGGANLDRQRLRICWQEMRDWITAVGVAFEPPLQQLTLAEWPLEQRETRKTTELEDLYQSRLGAH